MKPISLFLLLMLCGISLAHGQVTRQPDTLTHYKSLYVGVDAADLLVNGYSAILNLLPQERLVFPSYWAGTVHFGRDVVPTVRYNVSLGYWGAFARRTEFQNVVFQTIYGQGTLHFFKPLNARTRVGGYLGVHYAQTQGYFDVQIPGRVYDDFNSRIPFSQQTNASLLIGLSATKLIRDRLELALESNVFALPILRQGETTFAGVNDAIEPGLGWVNFNFLTLQGSVVLRYFFWKNLVQKRSASAG
ncbi:MAG: hypothetical protein AAFQ98_04520 [Bacteroidota bacterium]